MQKIPSIERWWIPKIKLFVAFLFPFLLFFQNVDASLTVMPVDKDILVYNYAIESYPMIRMSAGQNLSLRCQSTTANKLRWMLPIESNLDLEGFSEEDFLKKVTVEKEDERSQLFHIRSLEQSDTGTYSCLDDKNQTDFVYVFVEGLYDFLKPKTYTLDVTSSKFLLPCRYAQIGYWPVWPSLFVDGEEWLKDSKERDAVTFDSRYGFELDLVKLNRSLPMGSGRFRCVALNGDEVEWFVRFASMPVNSVSMTIPQLEAIALAFNKRRAWLVIFTNDIGKNVTVQCDLQLDNTTSQFENQLQMQCPRCGQNDGPKIQKDVQIDGNSTLFSLNVIFQEVKADDYGLYTCSWPQKVVNKWDAKTQQTSPFRIFSPLYRLHFAPHAEVLTVFHGEPIRIKATILPIAADFVNYTCTWSYTRYVDVGRQKVSSSYETASVDCGKRPYLKVDENGRVESYTEELFIPSHKLAPGGTYEISFLVSEERFQMIKWKVKVDTPVKDFTFNVQSSAHFVQFDKLYHVIGAKIRLGCHSRGHVDKNEKLRLFYQRSNKMVPATSVIGVKNVFWNTTVHEDLILGIFHQGSFHLRVAGQRPAVWMKRDPEISGEDPNRIYRGDDITLFCRVHSLADISMFWIYNQTVLDESSIVQSIDGDSVLLKMTIKNISTNNSGDYICVARKTETGQEFNQTIGLEIHEMIAPVLLVNETEIVHIKAGESQLLDCKMSGDPTPFISWSKNGIAMRDNESLLVNASIVLPKVDIDDSGVYECVGKNRVGEVRRSISLEVKDDKRRRLMLALVALSIVFLISLACVLNFVILWRRQKARARNLENAFRVLYDDLINGGTIPAQDRNKQIPLDQQINQIVYDRSKFEISCDDLQISDRKTLGSGQFGKVSMGFLKKPNQINNFTSETPNLKVAVKEPFHTASIRQHIINIQMLADELKLMSFIPPHPNVLTLIGAVTDHLTSGRLCVVTELCANGSLEKFLKNLPRNTFCNELRKVQNSEYVEPDRTNRGNTVELLMNKHEKSMIRKMSVDVVTDSYIPWTQVESQDEKHDGHEKTPIVQTFLCSTSDLLSFAMQIASGMEFLSEIPCIHRDLAARNILITEKNICRIADFGLARSASKSYYRKNFKKHKNDLLPVQWMSPESIESGYYTQASDVWSYGILLYELFTLGDRPYPGIPLEEIYMRVRNGERNQKPEFVHDDLYNFMLKCWNSKTKERPLFKDCVQKMREHLEMVLPGKAEEIEGKLTSEVDRLNSYSEWRNGNPGNPSENKREIEKQERRYQKVR